jgi:hypothetical protein
MFAKHWCRQLISQIKKCELDANKRPPKSENVSHEIHDGDTRNMNKY